VSRIVLGVSGSVAAYRAADLARDLMRAGHDVRVCLTDAAQNFVGPALFEALTGQPCLVDTFEEPEAGRMAHIDWARQADLVLIAPATANTINKLATGQAEDMLTTLALVSTRPLMIAPAMNPSMYAHEATQAGMRTLEGRGAIFVEPTEGDVACGENGQGKLASNGAILTAVQEMLTVRGTWAGKVVLITSGPTHEPIDDVRFIGNRSSGKMGVALARAASLLGAKVTLVTGPTAVMMPPEIRVVRIQTAVELEAHVVELAPEADVVIGAAAVADFRPAERVSGKIRRSEAALEITLVPNPDVIARAAQVAKEGSLVVAFAAEPDAGMDVAREKMARKGVSAIAVNDVSRSEIGFESDQNELTLIWADGKSAASGLRSKLGCALWLLDEIIAKQRAEG